MPHDFFPVPLAGASTARLLLPICILWGKRSCRLRSSEVSHVRRPEYKARDPEQVTWGRLEQWTGLLISNACSFGILGPGLDMYILSSTTNLRAKS